MDHQSISALEVRAEMLDWSNRRLGDDLAPIRKTDTNQ